MLPCTRYGARSGHLADAADRAVVVLDVPGGDVDAVRRLFPDSELVVVTQHNGRSGLRVFPLGTCYARNRGAELTAAPELVFVDSAEPSRQLVFTRGEFVGAGGFDHALGFGTARMGPHDAELADRLGRPTAAGASFARSDAVAAGRTARRLRSARLALRAALAGGMTGLRSHDVWRPPDARGPRLEGLPELTPRGASNPAKTHFLYDAGADTIVHLYVNPAERLRRALAEREQVRARVGDGVPALREVIDADDATWVVEDRVPGRAPEQREAAAWFPRARDWLVRFADPAGTKLNATASWREHAAALQQTFALDALPAALERVARLPAVAMHGDLQRRNLALEGHRVGAVDWEGVWHEGIPGLDLVYLALFARSDDPDFGVLDTLSGGEDVPWANLRPALAQLGVDDEGLPATLLVLLATWALSERRRRARLGAVPPPPTFETQLERRAAALGRRV